MEGSEFHGHEDFLDATQVQLLRSPRGQLSIKIAWQVHEEVSVRLAFPLDAPRQFVGFFAVDGTDLGMVERVDALEESSRQLVEEELEKTYFLPVITSVDDISEEFGVVEANVQTTSGPRHIEVRRIRHNIRLLPRNRALIEDVDGNRYELRERHRLPRLTRDIMGL